MRISFEEILFNNDYDVSNKVFYLSGNEETLIKKIEKCLVDKFFEIGITNVERLEALDDQSNNNDLFFEKNLIVLSSIKGLKIESIKKILNEKKHLIIVNENSRGDTSLKKTFEKEKDLILINCYQLNMDQKISVLNFFAQSNSVKMEKDVLWYIVENTSDRYVFFENEVVKIMSLNKKNYMIKDVRPVLSAQIGEDFYKLFFSVLKKNTDIVLLYNLTITNISDLYKLLQVIKFSVEIVSQSNTVYELEKNVPKYMFKQKNNFISIYRKITPNNKRVIYKLIYRAEDLIRKNASLYFPIGNRLLFSIKKNI